MCDVVTSFAPVAQLDRASDSGSEGWGFESLRAYHKNNHTFRCGYFYAYREDFTYPAEVNSACAKVFECPHPIRTVYMRLADRGV